MVEVEIRGFQSIEHAKFRIQGFTVLIGRSNIGKSSIIRAIQCALTGASGTDFVRHGSNCERRKRGAKKCKCFSQVTLRTDNLRVTWEKGDAVNRYIVLRAGEKETTVYDKIGRGVPDFLQPEFSPIKVGDSMNLVQVSEQFNPIFLLDQSGPAVADVLSDVARLDHINAAMRMVEKDRKADTSTRKVREKDVLSIAKSLKAYEGLDPVLDDVGRVEQRHADIQETSKALDKLDGFLGRAKTLRASVRALQASVEPSLPDGGTLEETARQAYQASQFFDALAVKVRQVRQLRGINDVTLPDNAPVEESLEEVRRIELWVQRLQDFKVRLKRWEGVEDFLLPDPEDMKSSLVKATEIQGFLERLVRLKEKQKRLESSLVSAESDEQAIIDEIQGLGICPTCSQNIEAGRCLHLEGS